MKSRKGRGSEPCGSLWEGYPDRGRGGEGRSMKCVFKKQKEENAAGMESSRY